MSDSYFRFPKPYWVALIGFGLYLLTAATFSPRSIPAFLGPIGRFGKYLGETYSNGVFMLLLAIVLSHAAQSVSTVQLARFVSTVLIHAAESVYTVHLARERKLNTITTIKWTIQTFLFGFSSFQELKKYKPRSS